MNATLVPQSMIQFITPIGGGAEFINVKEAPYNAIGNGIADDTVALNLALSDGFTSGKIVFFPPGVYVVSQVGTSGRCLLNQGASMMGSGAVRSIITFAAGTPNTVDMMKFAPISGADFVTITGLGWWPGYPNFSSALRGKRCIHFLWDGSPEVSSSKLQLVHNYFFPSNDYSIETECNTIILQGSPSNALIADNHFWGGVKLSNIGDSNAIMRNVIRAEQSGKAGLTIFVIDAGDGSAGHNVIRDNNIDSCPAGAIVILNGREYIIDGNNIEHRIGGGSSSSAAVDIDGSSGLIQGCKVTNNRIAVFGETTTQTALRINACSGAYINENNFGIGGIRAQAVAITANAVSARLGRNVFGSGWTAQVNNFGTDTLKTSYVAL